MNGTLSSYAWSILNQPLARARSNPYLQSGEDRVIVELEGKEYDVTIDEKASIENSSSKNIAELAQSFFLNYATRDWDGEVISIRNGGSISRDEKVG